MRYISEHRPHRALSSRNSSRSGQAPRQGRLRGAAARPVTRHLTLLVCYATAGVALTWPRAAFLAEHRLPVNRDIGAYVWDLWWIAHQAVHLGNPWFSAREAAPVGMPLGFDTVMPLAGLIMTPVTLAFGPSASFNVLSLILPGLLCYVTYRAARLWLRSQAGAIAAGAFFGLSTMIDFQAWYHLNVAAGALFLPMGLEASIRLRRRPGVRQGIILGLVLAGVILVDLESAIMVLLLTAAALLPSLTAQRLQSVGTSAVVAVAIASPELFAMAHQAAAYGLNKPGGRQYGEYSIGLTGIFAPSPRIASFGLPSVFHYQAPTEGVPTYGVVLSALAVAGLAAAWRRRSAWLLALGWLGSAALALGPTLIIGSQPYVPMALAWHQTQVSALMPYTWLIRIPGLSGFREADRLGLIGLVGAALLAGSAVDWLRCHARSAMVTVAALAVLEAGWSGGPPAAPGGLSMPTTLPALDRPIAADHSGSIVADVPFGLVGGLGQYGDGVSLQAMLLATADGHPRADAKAAWVPARVTAAIKAHPFYSGLVAAETGHVGGLAALAAARRDARSTGVGWVLVWPAPRQILVLDTSALRRYLSATGFRFDYRADGVSVFRAYRDSDSCSDPKVNGDWR
jgi:hypothetical protein